MLIELSSYRDDEMSKVGINKYDKLKQLMKSMGKVYA